MGQIANILDFRLGQRGKALSSVPPVPFAGRSGYARLIPGSASQECLEENAKNIFLVCPSPRSRITEALSACLPKVVGRIRMQMLIPAALDVGVITCISILGKFLFPRFSAGLSVPTLCLFIATFLMAAIEEELYARPRLGLTRQMAIIRTILLATFFAWLYVARVPGAGMSLLWLGLCSLLAMKGTRWVKQSMYAGAKTETNALIVGNGRGAQQIAEAIQRDPESRRVVKGFIAENHLRNVYGPSMLSRIARESFVDELIIASADPEVAKIAIQEARNNALDVNVVPQVCISLLERKLELQNVGGAVMLKVSEHRTPEIALAMKRSMDIAISLIALAPLSPVFLLIAALIKLDSRGPAVYRATRIGSKGREFHCYKFRTMIAEADEIKAMLRAKNERRGAFFKIENDPRITRVGQFLRRYSLDELPQLWNVLRGEMSLVGPRPHPPDDVSLYDVCDLQRLDFVPGITGLWQVTARRDPSFERSVALDVEYIKSWNLWLDVRILWRTIFVVLEGTGA